MIEEKSYPSGQGFFVRDVAGEREVTTSHEE